jgi:hypothetical protein
MSRTTRRSFAKAVAAATAVIASGGQAPRLSGQAGAPVLPALAEALVGVVRAQSGQYLDAADLDRIRADFKDYVPALERLRSVTLANSDEPDYTFASLTKRWP